MRRSACLLIAALAAALLPGVTPAAAAAPPSIVFVLLDDGAVNSMQHMPQTRSLIAGAGVCRPGGGPTRRPARAQPRPPPPDRGAAPRRAVGGARGPAVAAPPARGRPGVGGSSTKRAFRDRPPPRRGGLLHGASLWAG